jgi:hypothetical protein
MMSADYLASLKRDAERASRRNHVLPVILTLGMKEGRVQPAIPFIGERTWKKDWVEVDLKKLLPEIDPFKRGDALDTNIFFVDSSGFGSDGELAMTMRAFLAMAPAGFGYAVVESGHFQVCVRCYVPPKSCRMPGVNYDVAI